MPEKPLLHCPEGHPIAYGTWFQLLTGSDGYGFDICCKCFAEHIAPTALASSFHRTVKPQGRLTYCDFYHPRTRNVWKQCVASGTVAPLAQYSAIRSHVHPCPGNHHVPFTDDYDFYFLRGGNIEDFGVCRACYEDFIVANGMAKHFVLLSGAQKESHLGQQFLCDASNEWMHGALKTYTGDTFDEFLAAYKARASLPPCAGDEPVMDNRTSWGTSSIDGFAACEACFQDVALFTPFRDYFHPTEATPGRWTCDMAHASLRIAFHSAVEHNQFADFVNAASVVLATPPCTQDGLVDSDWFVLRGTEAGDSPFELCPSCYASIVVPLGVGHHFVQKRYADGSPAHICDFLATDPRTHHLVEHFLQAVNTGEWEHFSEFAAQCARIPHCPRDTMVGGPRFRWYGTASWAACEECFYDIIHGTPLEDALPVRGAQLEGDDTRWCELYSPRMRRLFAAACESGDLTALEKAAAERLGVHNLVDAQVKVLQGQQKMRFMQQMDLYHSAVMHQDADSILGAVGGSGCTYGNDVVGHNFVSEAGVEGVMTFRQAQSMNGGDEAQKVAALVAQWAKVE